MYLVHPVLGFFSVVVADPRDRRRVPGLGEDALAIRARDRRHLERFCQAFPDTLGATEILEAAAGRDYRWRILVPRAAVARLFGDLGAAVDWNNVKRRADTAWAGNDDRGFVDALIDVHHRLADLQRGNGRVRGNRARRAAERRSAAEIADELARLARSIHVAETDGDRDTGGWWEFLGAFAALAWAVGEWGPAPLSPDPDDEPDAMTAFRARIDRHARRVPAGRGDGG